MFSQPTALVIGPTGSASDRDELRRLAHDVADRLRFPARIAVGREYSVTSYEVVILASNFAESYEPAVLGCEARSADVCVLWDTDVDAYPYSFQCAHCFEGDTDARPRLSGDTWSVPVCSDCVREAVRVAATSPVAVAA